MFHHDPLLSAIASASRRKIIEFDTKHWVNIAWAYASLSLEAKPLLHAIASSARTSMTSFDSRQLANLAWSCANIGFADRPLMESLASAAIPKIHEWQTQDLQNTAWAYAMLRLLDHPLLQAISQRFRARGAELDKNHPPGHHVAEYRWRTRSNDPWEPWISMYLRDMVVVMKPAAWQVDTDDVGTPVRRFTHWISRRL